MGFRNPITTATDPVAQQAAANAQTTANNAATAAANAQTTADSALTQIIPGTRLAADAIDGKVITGATFRTAGSGAQRVQIDSTNGLVGYDATGAAKTQVGTNGKLTATDATVTGSLSAAGVINTITVDGATPGVGGISGAGVRWQNVQRSSSTDATLTDQTDTIGGTPTDRRIRLTGGTVAGFTGTIPYVDVLADTGFNQRTMRSTITLVADALTATGLISGSIPAGIAGYGTTSAGQGSITSTIGVELTAVRFSCRLRPGRAYRPETLLRMSSTVAGDVAGIVIKLGTSSPPATTDPNVAAMTATCTTAGVNFPVPAFARRFQVTTDTTYYVSLWAYRVSGSGTLTVNPTSMGDISLVVNDEGPAPTNLPMITL